MRNITTIPDADTLIAHLIATRIDATIRFPADLPGPDRIVVLRGGRIVRDGKARGESRLWFVSVGRDDGPVVSGILGTPLLGAHSGGDAVTWFLGR